MKTFKQFLMEETVNTSTQPSLQSDVQMTDFNLPQQQTSPTPNKFTPKPQQQAKQQVKDGNKESDNQNMQRKEGEEKEEEDNEPKTEEEWRQKNPEPSMEDFDKNGDGELSGEELEEYRFAFEEWLYRLQIWRIEQTSPRGQDDPGGQYHNLPGRYDEEYQKYIRALDREWWQRLGEKPKEPVPGQLPPGVDYDFWWNIWKQLYGKDGSMHQFYDWVWRVMRHERPGFEHVIDPMGDAPVAGRSNENF